MIDWLPDATRLSPWSQATVVVAGLAAGDEVVVHSERELAEGAQVKVVSQLVGAPR